MWLIFAIENRKKYVAWSTGESLLPATTLLNDIKNLCMHVQLIATNFNLIN